VIHSRARLSYEQAQAMLDGAAEPEGVAPGTAGMLREAWRMASVLRRRRFEGGALDLEMPEIRVRLDADGRAVGVEPVGHGPSHQLIEECMLAANEAVARLLRERQKPAIYRVHEEPDAGKLFEFGEEAKAHGYRVGDLTNRRHIQRLLDDARGNPDEHAIKLGLLKSLKRAAYAAEALGHYGLAKADYCHFTSPIRRYADLVVHRALQPLIENPAARADRNPAQGRLREIASHISETERNSAEAENESRQLKLLEFLGSLAEQGGEPQVFDGVITDLRHPGLVVEALDIATRGMIKRGDLPGHDWRYEAGLGRFVRRDGFELKIGQRIGMVVARVDRGRGFVDFRLAGRGG
jgi:ribonuclease R